MHARRHRLELGGKARPWRPVGAERATGLLKGELLFLVLYGEARRIGGWRVTAWCPNGAFIRLLGHGADELARIILPRMGPYETDRHGICFGGTSRLLRLAIFLFLMPRLHAIHTVHTTTILFANTFIGKRTNTYLQATCGTNGSKRNGESSQTRMNVGTATEGAGQQGGSS